jgi:hypothetical protein
LNGHGTKEGEVEALKVAAAWADMSPPQLVATVGAAIGFLGGVLLAFAASGEIGALRLAVLALQAETSSLISAANNPSAPLVRVTGTGKHLDAGKRRNIVLTWCGVIMLLLSFVLTVASLFVASPSH